MNLFKYRSTVNLKARQIHLFRPNNMTILPATQKKIIIRLKFPPHLPDGYHDRL